MNDTMTPPKPTPPAQPRGAGSGEKANAGRTKLDIVATQKPHSEHVAELEEKAQADAAKAGEIADAQAELAIAFQEKLAELQEKEPDEAFDASDPRNKAAALKGEMKARAERDKAATAK